MTSAEFTRFKMIFWFIVGLCIFGMGLTVFLVIYLPKTESTRIADTAMIFWLSTAVGGGIGYLIGSSMNKTTVTTTEGATTVSTTKTETVTKTDNTIPSSESPAKVEVINKEPIDVNQVKDT